MSTSSEPNALVTSKKITCSNLFTCVVFPSFAILTVQVLMIALAFIYGKFNTGNINNILPDVSFHQNEDDDDEEIVHLDFQNN